MCICVHKAETPASLLPFNKRSYQCGDQGKQKKTGEEEEEGEKKMIKIIEPERDLPDAATKQKSKASAAPLLQVMRKKLNFIFSLSLSFPTSYSELVLMA